MPPKSKSKSKSNGRKSKAVPKPKQIWRVKQPTRNWLELPSDLMLNILQRLGVFDRLENAQKVCTAWRQIFKDPAMWRLVYIDRYSSGKDRLRCKDMCKHAVNRSRGQLLDLTVIGFCDNNLLQYVADRSNQLRRLEIVQYYHDESEVWREAFRTLPLLEELSLVETKLVKEDIEAAARHCPLLKTLKLNQKIFKWDGSCEYGSMVVDVLNERALAIGKNLPQLTHLELIGNSITNVGLQAILDGCCHLESLDLRRCLYIDLDGDLGKRCSQQIKYPKFPSGRDSVQGFKYTLFINDSDSDDEYLDYDDAYLDYDDEYSDYDDYTAYHNDGLSEMMAFMDNDGDLSEMMAFMDIFG
ncbi:putative F-box domain, leucine-rich repeat domain superfamily, F-box-like domain superfamily [Helianthus debilis subsp. tardiflorus]